MENGRKSVRKAKWDARERKKNPPNEHEEKLVYLIEIEIYIFTR